MSLLPQKSKRSRRILTAFVASVVLVFTALLATFRFDLPLDELKRKYANAQSKFMAIDGMQVHYRDQGVGEVIVLLHGSNASLHTWSAWAAKLKNDYRVISLDLPGHGLTGPHPKSTYDWSAMASVVQQLVSKLGVQRLTVAGNSMGGAVAMRFAFQNRNIVERLVLLDSRGLPPDEPAPILFRAFAMPVVGDLMRWLSPRFAVAGSLRDVYGDPHKVSEALITRYLELGLREGNRRATQVRFSTQPKYKNVDDIATLDLPSLVLWGRDDRWILPKYGDRLHALLPNSTLVVLDGLGHAPMEEDPQASLSALRSFLAANKANQ